MHLEFLVEDESGRCLLEGIIEKIMGPSGSPHTWRIHRYRGVGHLPKDLKSTIDPSRRVLLDRLPSLLKGYARTPGIDAIVVLVDNDARDCKSFLQDLRQTIPAGPKILFRLAMEEIESWLLGDRQALLNAYPGAKASVLDSYKQDSTCGTWELLADAVHSGGASSLEKQPYSVVGKLKSEWALRIASHMAPERNASPSFRKFVEGLQKLTA
jgi:hypothetical protein